MEPAKESNPPPPSLFSSLPEDIVLSILARISTSYYPTLSLVSKTFRSLILSEDLDMVRSHLGTKEKCVYVSLQSFTNPCDRRWFSLWIEPDDHQTLTDCTNEDKCTGNLLLRMPSSYSPRLPIFHETIGSETYKIGGQNTPSSTDVWVYNKLVGKRCKAPSMMVARKNAFTCSLDGKLYVMGGCDCEAGESTHWAEVFDPKTQTWEPLPDPGDDLRFSTVIKLEPEPGKVYVRTLSQKKKLYVRRTTMENFVYLTKESRWEIVEENMGESICKIENVWYCYDRLKCTWYDTKSEEWRLVKGLTELDRHFRCGVGVEIGPYGGKLVIVWVGPAVYPYLETPEIMCAVILLEKRLDGEVWGQVEWVDIVLTAPWSHSLLRCVESVQ